VTSQIVTFVSPCHARYWRCDIEGASNGKLHGKTIAIKDNICVAGVPMMTGSRILEGYIPDMDATVVTRILDSGGRITGKAVCESLCSSGGSFTSATGPVLHPLDDKRMTGGSSSGCGALVKQLICLKTLRKSRTGVDFRCFLGSGPIAFFPNSRVIEPTS